MTHIDFNTLSFRTIVFMPGKIENTLCVLTEGVTPKRSKRLLNLVTSSDALGY